MKKGLLITLISIGVVLLILIIMSISSYNGLVDKEEAVKPRNLPYRFSFNAELI